MKTEQALEQVAYLRDLVEQTRVRAADTWPYFMLWGLIVPVGYLASWRLSEERAAWVWMGLVLGGAIVSFVIGRTFRRGGRTPALMRRLGWIAAVVFAAGELLPNVLMDLRADAELAYPPFLWGVIYVLWGVLAGWELVVIGAWTVAAACVSVAFSHDVQALWLAAASGIGLLATGVLLRRRAGAR